MIRSQIGYYSQFFSGKVYNRTAEALAQLLKEQFYQVEVTELCQGKEVCINYLKSILVNIMHYLHVFFFNFQV